MAVLLISNIENIKDVHLKEFPLKPQYLYNYEIQIVEWMQSTMRSCYIIAQIFLTPTWKENHIAKVSASHVGNSSTTPKPLKGQCFPLRSQTHTWRNQNTTKRFYKKEKSFPLFVTSFFYNGLRSLLNPDSTNTDSGT